MHSRVCMFLIAACFLGIIVCGPMNVYAAEKSSPYNVPKGVYLNIDKVFYKVPGNSQGDAIDASLVYLQMILKKQEEIIQKLNLLLESRDSLPTFDTALRDPEAA